MAGNKATQRASILTVDLLPEDHRDLIERIVNLFQQARTRHSMSTEFRLVDEDGNEVKLPASLSSLVEEVATTISNGDSLALVPVAAELTTQQAAELLNVSRQYLVRLLDAEQIPYRRIGTHRRVQARDLLMYKRKRDAERRARLRELTELTEELGGYDELSEL